MKLEIKNVKINLTFSEETIQCRGNIYIDGKKVGEFENEGRGGCTWCQPISKEGRIVMEKYEEWVKTQPEVKLHDLSCERSLEFDINTMIDEMVNKKEIEKFEKKKQKEMLTRILYTKDDPSKFYNSVGWKGVTIQQLINHPNGRTRLIELIKEKKREGFQILNTNIPQDILNS